MTLPPLDGALGRAVWLLASLEGRAGRLHWWLGFLALRAAELGADRLPSHSLQSLAVALLLWPQICVDGKRLHDHGRSAWWQIPLVLLSATQIWPDTLIAYGRQVDARVNWPELDPSVLVLIGLLGVGLVAAYFVYFGFRYGPPGRNRYDPAPVADVFS